MKLTEIQKKELEENGCLILKNFFSNSMVKKLSFSFDQTIKGCDARKEWSNSFGFRKQLIPFFEGTENCGYQNLTEVSELFGNDFEMTASEGIVHSMNTSWHYDGVAPTSEDFRHYKAIAYLDKCLTGEGALSVIKGSNKKEFWKTFDNDNSSFDTKTPLSENVLNFEVSPGDLIILDVKTIHAVFANNHMRRVIYYNYLQKSYLMNSKSRVSVSDKVNLVNKLVHEIETMEIRSITFNKPKKLDVYFSIAA